MSVKNSFIRGSVVRYVHLPKADVNTHMLQVRLVIEGFLPPAS